MADANLAPRGKSLLDKLCETPRFAGTPEEKRARAICRAELEAGGFDCRELPFEYSQWPARWGPPLSAAALAATIIAVARMAREGRPLMALAIGGALFAILFLVDGYARRRWIKSFPAQRSQSVNLEARRGTPRVWLVAHLDSKSQTVPMLIRIAGSIAVVTVAALTIVTVLLAIVGLDAGERVWNALQAAAVVAALPGVSCFVRNGSVGAVDNATGVVAAILAAQSPSAPTDLGVIITSAEELGLAGARAWCGSAQLKDFILNCDTVDDVGDWRAMYTTARPKRLGDAAEGVAARLALRLRVGRLIPGILADSIPFSDRGIEAVTISRGTFGTLARIHTRRDFSTMMTGKGAAEASVLLSALAKELA
jgi:hypothetical protein